MRFLTPDWHRGELSDDEATRAETAFEVHQAALAAAASEPIRELATGRSLHDALVVSVTVDRSRHRIDLVLLAGDQQRGYFERRITYDEVALDRVDTTVLATIARDPRTELLYTELDRGETGLYSHSLLFWPHYREVALPFARVQVFDQPVAARILPDVPDRYSDSYVAAV